MYNEFFKLDRKPFELVPDPDFIYLSRSHKRALTYLDYGVRDRAGFILLTGDVGSGKTTLIRDLIGKHYDKVVLAKIFNTRVNSEQMLAMINDDFGLAVNGKGKVALMRELNDFLLEQYAAGNQPILVIDEAQNLGNDLLEEVRLLSNLENSQCKLLQIVLVGQPELRKTLAAPGLLQLRQRISINCHLRPLSRQELAEYVVHRLKVAGNAKAIDFPEPALDVIFKYSRGIPRLINIFCDFIMLAAFAEESRVASLDIVNEVVGELDFENHFWAVSVPPADGEDVPQGVTVRSAAPAGEEASAPAAMEQPVPAENPVVFAELSRRLQLIEEQGRGQLSALRSLNDTLAAMRVDLAAQVASTQSSAKELRARVESVSSELQFLELCRSETNPAPTGLARRLLDGLTGSNVKK